MLDTAQAIVPDYVRTACALLWASEAKPNNPIAGADVASESDLPPVGVLTPSRWASMVTRQLKGLERGDGFPAPVLADVDANPVVAEFDSVARRIMSAVNVVPAPQNHSIGVSVRQVA